MLVLSRQRDETIMIGDDIEVTVVDIRGDKVRLGITAPKEIAVHRKEVYEAIKRENRAAAQVKPEDIAGLGGGGASGPTSGQAQPPRPSAGGGGPDKDKPKQP
jgi:carbon storage regulator